MIRLLLIAALACVSAIPAIAQEPAFSPKYDLKLCDGLEFIPTVLLNSPIDTQSVYSALEAAGYDRGEDEWTKEYSNVDVKVMTMGVELDMPIIIEISVLPEGLKTLRSLRDKIVKGYAKSGIKTYRAKRGDSPAFTMYSVLKCDTLEWAGITITDIIPLYFEDHKAYTFRVAWVSE